MVRLSRPAQHCLGVPVVVAATAGDPLSCLDPVPSALLSYTAVIV